MINSENYFHELRTQLMHVQMLLSRSYKSKEEVNAILLNFMVLRRVECALDSHRYEMHDLFASKNGKVDQDRMDDYLYSFKTRNYNTTGITLDSVWDNERDMFSLLMEYQSGFDKEIRGMLDLLGFESVVASLNYKNRLLPVVRAFARMEMHPSVVSGTQMASLLDRYVGATSMRSFTENDSPSLFSMLCSELLYDENITGFGKFVYDPVCGRGSLLINTAKALDLKVNDGTLIYGQDINPANIAYTVVKAWFLGMDTDKIKTGNTLTDDQFPDMKFQYQVADLPMNMSWQAEEQDLYWGYNNNRFSAGYPSVRDASLLFIQHMISKMDPMGSKVAVFTNYSPLFNGSVDSGESNIRKWILSNDLIETIIALPKRSSMGTNVQRYMWILSNNKPTNRVGKVCLIDCNKLLLEKVNSIHTDEDLVYCLKDLINLDEQCNYKTIVDNKQFGSYQITLINKQTGKKQQVQAPVDGDVYDYLKKKGFKISLDESPHYVHDDSSIFGKTVEQEWIVDYPKTTVLYQIDFFKFFTEMKPTDAFEDSLTRTTQNIEIALQSLKNLQLSLKPIPYKDIFKETDSWCGNVPYYWQAVPASTVLTIRSGVESSSSGAASLVPLLNIDNLRATSSVVRRKIPQDKAVIVSSMEPIIVTRGSNAGEVYFPVIKNENSALSSFMAVVRTEDSSILDDEYLRYLCVAAKDYFKSNLQGSNIHYLKISSILEMTIYLPPISEQKQIAQYLNSVCSSITSLNEILGVQSPVFEQFRNSLIFEVVTGKVDLDSLK